MKHLNYQHLYYFFMIVREGSIVKAAQALHLRPQTISGQLTQFESYIGRPLFDRKGKRLVLNQHGKVAYQYAEDIFSLGNELRHALGGDIATQQTTFTIGVTDIIPKILTFDLIETFLGPNHDNRVICREGDFDGLISELAMKRLDVVISDRPLTPGTAVKAYNHCLGEAGLTFYAHQKDKYLTQNFPQSLDNQPFLICSDQSTQRLSLNSWFADLRIAPKIVAEFDDSALLKLFGQSGHGVFCTTSLIEAHVIQQYGVSVIGRTSDITERIYAISPERKLKHPHVKRLVSHAKQQFAI